MGLFMFLLKVDASEVPDRRRRARLRLSYRLRLRRPGEMSRVETKTENVSCEGFFCLSERPFSSRETLECELVIPRDEIGQPLEQEMILRYRAEVVRVVPEFEDSLYGIACRLIDHTIDWQAAEEPVAVEYLS